MCLVPDDRVPLAVARNALGKVLHRVLKARLAAEAGAGAPGQGSA